MSGSSFPFHEFKTETQAVPQTPLAASLVQDGQLLSNGQALLEADQKHASFLTSVPVFVDSLPHRQANLMLSSKTLAVKITNQRGLVLDLEVLDS